MSTDVQSGQRSASLKDRDVLHVQQTFSSQVERSDILNRLHISLISSIEEEGPVCSSRSEFGVDDLKVWKIFTDMIKVHAVLDDRVTIHPESPEVGMLLD